MDSDTKHVLQKDRYHHKLKVKRSSRHRSRQQQEGTDQRSHSFLWSLKSVGNTHPNTDTHHPSHTLTHSQTHSYAHVLLCWVLQGVLGCSVQWDPMAGR